MIDWNEVARAEELLYKAYAASRKHTKLAREMLSKYGERGPMISGCVQEHFPNSIKDQLRDLASQVGRLLDQSLAAWKSAGRRRSTWMEAKNREIELHGRGYYG